MELPYHPASPLLGIYLEKMKTLDLKRWMHHKGQSSTVYNLQDIDATTDGWVDKDVCMYTHTYNGMLLLLLLLLLLSHFSRVRLCATPQTAAHQAPPSLRFFRQEHWSRLPFPSPVHESEKWKWSRAVVSDSSRPHGLQPTRLLHPWMLLSIKKNVIMPFAATCLDLEIIILSKVSQTKKDKYHLLSLICGI